MLHSDNVTHTRPVEFQAIEKPIFRAYRLSFFYTGRVSNTTAIHNPQQGERNEDYEQTDQLSPSAASQVYLSRALAVISGSNTHANNEQTLASSLKPGPVLCLKAFFPTL